jgi:prepilin-type N-terminal cleavage/methylation domain-containing protein
MTLVEVLVAMAIIAIIGVMCFFAFNVAFKTEMRETSSKKAGETVEANIAEGATPTSTQAITVNVGGYDLAATASTYQDTEGSGDIERSRTFTIIE